MNQVKLRTIAFPEGGNYSAKLDFGTSNDAGSAEVTIIVQLWKRDDNDVNSRAYHLVIDDADVVREGRRKLHEFATLLAEQTKHWAV